MTFLPHHEGLELVDLPIGYIPHPNAPAIPSGADADAAQETPGVDLILGLRFSPSGPLPWFDDVEGKRRILGKEATINSKSNLDGNFTRRDDSISCWNSPQWTLDS